MPFLTSFCSFPTFPHLFSYNFSSTFHSNFILLSCEIESLFSWLLIDLIIYIFLSLFLLQLRFSVFHITSHLIFYFFANSFNILLVIKNIVIIVVAKQNFKPPIHPPYCICRRRNVYCMLRKFSCFIIYNRLHKGL
jgi:predicted membrane protein